jgi:predicted O-methyltransferase YrrM
MDAMREVRLAVSVGVVRPRKLAIPSVSVADLFPKPLDVRLIDLDQVDGNTTLQEQVILIALAKRKRVRKVFEFGTFDGKTAANFAANLGVQAKILTIDLEPTRIKEARLPIGKYDLKFIQKSQIGVKSREFANVLQLRGDTAQFDFTPWYGTQDLVFVDACHEYDYVRNDTEIAFKLTQTGGLIIWHDYGTWVGVTRALNEFYARDPRFRALRNVAGTALCFLDVVREQAAEREPQRL